MDKVDSLERAGRLADRILPGPVYGLGRRLYYAYMQNSALNAVRRRRDYALLRRKSRRGGGPSELHLGCGRDSTDMCDVDIIKTRATDYVLDARDLPFVTDSIDRIETYHMIEHIPRHSFTDMLTEWKRVLRPGGTLVAELPDFDGVVKAYLETDDPEYTDTLLRYVFGSQRFESDVHYWGWNEERLGKVLHEHGFEDISNLDATDSHADEAPCMRLEATASE
jgi:predicted SAM-dependent methyltransferase